MIGYFPDEGLIFMLQQVVANNLKIHIFTNNITPSDATTLAGLTEAAWGGYASQVLTSGSWVSLGVASHIGTLVYPPVTFTNSSGGSVTNAYGFYITDNAVSKLVAVGLFDSSPVTIPNGGTYTFIPTIGDQDVN